VQRKELQGKHLRHSHQWKQWRNITREAIAAGQHHHTRSPSQQYMIPYMVKTLTLQNCCTREAAELTTNKKICFLQTPKIVAQTQAHCIIQCPQAAALTYQCARVISSIRQWCLCVFVGVRAMAISMEHVRPPISSAHTAQLTEIKTSKETVTNRHIHKSTFVLMQGAHYTPPGARYLAACSRPWGRQDRTTIGAA